MPAVLVGYGPNDVEITILVFDSLQEGREKCKEIFGVEGKDDTWDLELESEEPYAVVRPSDEEMKPFNKAYEKATDDKKEVARKAWRKEYEKRSKSGPAFDIGKLFKSYYGGCGECYRAKLKEVKSGEVFATWNLD